VTLVHFTTDQTEIKVAPILMNSH